MISVVRRQFAGCTGMRQMEGMVRMKLFVLAAISARVEKLS